MMTNFAARFSPRAIKDAVASGTGIVLGTQLVINATRLISTLILTRLLSPGDYGVLGIISVTHYSIVMLSDFGIASYIIRNKVESDKRALNVIWTIKFIRLLAIAIVLCLAAWPIAFFFGKPELTVAIMFSSLTFIAAGPESLSIPLALRQKRIAKVSAIDIGLALGTVLITITLALFIPNYWAVLIALTLSGFCRTFLSFFMFEESGHRFAYDRAVARDLWGFARYAFRSSIITLGILQIDKFVLGSLMPVAQFGLYMLAVSVVTMPRLFADTYGVQVLLPAYAQTNREAPDRLPFDFHHMTRRIGPIYGFLVGGLLSFAPVVIAVMYQDHYGGAAYYLAILCIPALFALTSIAATECLFAIGEIRVTYFANLIRLGWLLPAMTVAYLNGNIEVILLSIAFSEIPAAIFLNWWLWRKGIFSISKLMPTLGASISGILTGWLAYRGVATFFEIDSIGLFP